ncbi:uncharacterized protein K444DRAFT_186212 [Hyaloscypha bicolor E]|uniref:Uncharacterized protein n=1 Tax=Hyaloscypha bicolor E TaxID=1095630 RepID=A0A2J6SQX5_9HELO|nr:uncharacterized protein K444DRAFT_186212 [Hyaloscypha bicolor E]PMD53178.1 hypothetical protein K444DRAFT_186212 [Hyaloscypha bicolor E]
MKRKLLDTTSWLEANCFSLLANVSAAQGDNLAAEVYRDKAEASGTQNASLDEDPEIKAAWFASIITSRTGVGIVSDIIEFSDYQIYDNFLNNEGRDGIVAIYAHDLAWPVDEEAAHLSITRELAEYNLLFPR